MTKMTGMVVNSVFQFNKWICLIKREYNGLETKISSIFLDFLGHEFFRDFSAPGDFQAMELEIKSS